MADLLFDFEMHRDSRGYELAKGRVVPKGGKRVPCGQLVKIDTLYRVFAGLKTPVDLLKFVKMYGLLTGEEPHYELDDPVLETVEGPLWGDSVHQCLKAAREFEQLLQAKQLGAKAVAAKLRSRGMGTPAAIRLVPDVKQGARLKIRTINLLAALQGQLMQDLAGDVRVRACAYCAKWFEVGSGTDRRGDAKFCCDEHRRQYHGHTRSGKQEQKLCLQCRQEFVVGRGTGKRPDAKFCCDEHRIIFNSHKRSKGE
jgi:hypothetical protein